MQKSVLHHNFEELAGLPSELLYLASLAEKAVELSIQALQQRDAALAQKVITDDLQLDRRELAIEELCVTLLARQRLTAGELRTVVSALKINNDLERIGDHAVNIAGNTLTLLQEPVLELPPEIPRLAGLAQLMVRDAIDAFVHREATVAVSVCRRDDEADALNQHILRVLIDYMTGEARRIAGGLSLILVSRNLERIADLSTNIAEEVVYMVEARTIKHRHR
ncbi:MAG: phosphate signaling complex protein PhoU [candidate division KSB1 bacterium]|nr:phosphate signaling complex protein PhoU [candidate division KSB1 bacterium]MDZ7273300.1 phosphate signaling complex protein PhoU [candidate division KSB1 bacterium]MDZ7285402.1 phosphate signaling complex protein PhoU [candidate division KSB1 bacterium]MDZ7298434.1 phosphate signaling complex protein PhoU [candidate division KSB1 bacterium]MDZ7308535.1 phosphate signaling complex protein PhoU [candidate division KSB1 bacterium]